MDTIGWRSVFFVNLPLAAVAVALALKIPADRDAKTGEALDVWGAWFAVLALGLLSYGLIALGDGQVLVGIIAVLAAGPAIWVFLRVEVRADEPMMPLGIFRNVSFSGVNGMTVLLYAALSAALFMLPFVLIKSLGYSAMAAGAAFLPFSILMGLGSRWSGGLVKRIGARLPLVLGPAVTGGGFVLLAVSGHITNYWTGFFPGLVIVGIGMTLSVAPLTTTVFDSVPAAESGVASGINNASARVGSLLAVAALGLSFGGSVAPSLNATMLLDAYRLIMLAAAALAALSALVAAGTIKSRE